MTLLLVAACLIIGAEPAEQPVERATVLVVVGAPGAPEYEQPFAQSAERWKSAAEKADAKYLRVGDPASEETTDRKQFEALLAAEPTESTGALWLVLIGHGTFDGETAKFNLRGSDVSARELGQWLASLKRPVAVINGASASAPFVNRLSAPGRVVITATKSGYEHNYARFGEYISRAIADPAADLDKDEQTSLLEAFLSASGRVAEFYEQEGRLATETALLDDNGDGLGTPAEWFRGTRAVRRAKDGASLDGVWAGQFHLIRSREEQDLPAELRARRDELERAVAALRDGKGAATDEDAYYVKLERLLVELARLYTTLDEPARSPQTEPSSR